MRNYARHILLTLIEANSLQYLSVSHIYIPAGATCTFYGDHGSVTSGTGSITVDVGPPQPQVSGTCRAS